MAALAIVSASAAAWQVPILVYHRFAPQAADSMTVRTEAFEDQLRQLAGAGFRPIPLRQLVDHLGGDGSPLPARAFVLGVDDGHRSVHTALRPVVLRHRIPVTLFIYPSAIANADYVLTWQQLAELRATGPFDIQSHTYWHPNLRKAARPDAETPP